MIILCMILILLTCILAFPSFIFLYVMFRGKKIEGGLDEYLESIQKKQNDQLINLIKE